MPGNNAFFQNGKTASTIGEILCPNALYCTLRVERGMHHTDPQPKRDILKGKGGGILSRPAPPRRVATSLLTVEGG